MLEALKKIEEKLRACYPVDSRNAKVVVETLAIAREAIQQEKLKQETPVE